MSVQNGLASVAVKDLDAAASWYERLLEVPAKRPMPEVAEWHFERGGGLQVYLLPERAGSCSATLTVDDIEAQPSRLRALNIAPGKRLDNSRVPVIMIKDPDGNSIAIVQATDPTPRIVRPDRYRNAVVPHIYVSGASDGIAFYKRAFGAVELFRIAHPDGKILHAEISIGGSVVMIGDPDDRLYGEPRRIGRCTAGLHIFLDDNAALMRRAVEAGAELIQPPTEMFYGANSASVRDPFGHVWVLLSWKEDLDPAEMERRGKALLSK
jgi:PhnB protein